WPSPISRPMAPGRRPRRRAWCARKARITWSRTATSCISFSTSDPEILSSEKRRSRMDEEAEDGAMELDEADFLEARIDNISVSNLGFIVFLRPEGDSRVLPIFIGANEAHSIAIAFNNQVPPRPLTHDLLKNILGLLDVEVVKIQV